MFPFVPSLKREQRKLNTSNLYFSIKKTNWLARFKNFKSLNVLQTDIFLQTADKTYSYLNVSLCSCSEALGKEIEHCTSNLYFSIKNFHPNEMRHHLTSCKFQKNQQQERVITHHQDDCEKNAGGEHDGEAVQEPRDPMDTVAQPHHPHRLLQAHLLLVHDRLDDHGGGVDPGEGHEEGKGSGDGDDEPVLDIAGVGHLLQGHSWQGADVPPCVLGDDGVLHHVLGKYILYMYNNL